MQADIKVLLNHMCCSQTTLNIHEEHFGDETVFIFLWRVKPRNKKKNAKIVSVKMCYCRFFP